MLGMERAALWGRSATFGIVLLLMLAEAACSEGNDPPSDTAASPATPSSASGNPGERSVFAGDEAWIAYQTDRSGSESVWLVHPDGSDDHALETDLSASILLPDWSPDGSRLAFTSRGGETEPLYEYNLDSQEPTQLFECTAKCLGDDEPAYSPDGKSVAFVRYLAPFVNDAPSDCGLWVGNLDTGRVRQLTSNTEPPCDREYSRRGAERVA